MTFFTTGADRTSAKHFKFYRQGKVVKNCKEGKMKRDFLKELGLSDDQINSIMAENGKDIEKAKGDFEKISTELEQTKADLEKANATMDKFKDYDQTKADVEKYKADLEKSKADYEQKIEKMERISKIKDFTSSKKFVNDFTRDSINNLIDSELSKKDNKKSIEELFKEMTDGKSDILKAENVPTPPKVLNMTDQKDTKDNENRVREIMGLPPKN